MQTVILSAECRYRGVSEAANIIQATIDEFFAQNKTLEVVSVNVAFAGNAYYIISLVVKPVE